MTALLTWVLVAPLIPAQAEIDSKDLAPKGQYYEAVVPGTLDLAERARLAVQGLTRFLDPGHNWCPYGQGFFNLNPPMMTNSKPAAITVTRPYRSERGPKSGAVSPMRLRKVMRPPAASSERPRSRVIKGRKG